MKDNKRTTIITSIICLLPIIAAIAVYQRLPETVVTHWGVNGEPNGWMSRFAGAIVLPTVMLIVNLCMPLLLKLDPKYENINAKTKALLMWIIPAMSVMCSTATLGTALGFNTKVEIIAPLLVGIIFTVIGNYLPKMGQSYTVGIKLPWTLNSEENWNRTHRIAGILWVICGIAIMALSFVPGTVRVIVMGVLFVAMIIVPVIYSYSLFRKGI